MIRQEIKSLIEKAIEKLQEKGIFPKFDIPEIKMESPDDKIHGDYSTNFAIVNTRLIKKEPAETAGIIKLEIDRLKPQFFERIEVARPGFINFWVSQNKLEKLFSEAVKKGIKFFQKKPDKKETIVIEYSSPNIAKPLGIHHLPTTIIGQTLVNILRFAGHKVVSLSFPGDWGTQFGLLIAGFKHWGGWEKLKKNPVPEMLNLYVRFSQAAEADPNLLAEGRQEFKKLEQGDPENRKLWQWFTKESLKDFSRVYRQLGVKIENTINESFYEPELKPLIKEALKKGVAERGKDGSAVIKITGSNTPEIIQKSDGSTIYTTRELAAIRHRFKKWRATKILYVAANQQTFHLNQVFGAAEKLGLAKKSQLCHVKFGMVLESSGKKFATREGRLIPLEKVLKEGVERAKKIVEKLNPSLPEKEKEKIAQIVGIGAIKFFVLSRNRLSDIIFDWEQILNLKGFSAPYIQYTYARLFSILRKANFRKTKNLRTFIAHPLEREIIFKIINFDETLEEIAKNYFPNQLAEYLYDLCNILNNFYETLPVLKAKKGEKESRLNLVYMAGEILKEGLNLLGIAAPEKM